MHIHFIAIGGAAMHNLAIALKHKGYTITGSDDEIFEPSRTRLHAQGLLPEKYGWFPEKISKNIDAIVLGMHARSDNPELLKAQELGVKIYSYPEYLYEQTKDKKRIVVGGSHGKTTITSMIMHVLRFHNKKFDYMVGSIVEGFDTMVNLSNDSTIAVFEGDEYLSSPIDPRPKFHLYKPTVGIISGIAWDHINVFPTWDIYKEQFKIFIEKIENGGKIIYNSLDEDLEEIVQKTTSSIAKQPYRIPEYEIIDNICHVYSNSKKIPLKIFGKHNLQNILAAKYACEEAEVTEEMFFEAIQSFTGAAKRLQKLGETEKTCIFLDFAHSPSKLKATIDAVKEQFPKRELIACMELHTFSSLTKEFLMQYANSMEKADIPVVFYNPATIVHKKLQDISPKDIQTGFSDERLTIFDKSADFKEFVERISLANKNLLLMSSGNFAGIEFSQWIEKLLK